MDNSDTLDERALLAALAALGLTITPDTNGWGYTWRYGEWVGPFSSPLAAVHAGFTAALLALSVAPVAGPSDDEEVQAFALLQKVRHASKTGKLQEGRIAHIELNRTIDRWLKNVIDRWVEEQEKGKQS